MSQQKISGTTTVSECDSTDTRTSPSGGRVNTNKMGVLGAISYIIGNVVGSGIFIAPTTVLAQTDSVGVSLLVWAIAALISILGALCYVELGTSIRTSGADFAYLCYVKWYPLAFGFMCVGCVVLFPVAIAVQAQTFSEYLIQGFRIEICDAWAAYMAKKLLGFALIWLLMFMNFFSLKTFVSRFQIVATFAKITATAIVIITGFYFLIFKGMTENISAPFEDAKFQVGTMVSAILSGLFAYDGWDILNYGAEEIEKPRRTMPLAIIIGLTSVAFIYLATNVSYFVVLTKTEVLESSAVASTFAQHTLGNFQYAIPFLVSILLIGSLNGSIFSASRYLHAAARQGHLPPFISCANDQYDSPRAALVVCILLSMAMSFAGDLDTLINYASFAQWLQRACTMCALVWIRLKHKPVHQEAIRTPIFLPIGFAAACLALIVVETIHDQQVSGMGFAALFGGFIIYFLFLYDKSLPSLKTYQRVSKALNYAVTMVTQVLLNALPERNNCGEFTEALLMNTCNVSTTFSAASSANKPPIATAESSFKEKTKRFFGRFSSKVADVSAAIPKAEEAKTDVTPK
uniref:Cystine/glutamate transporter n=1 Tax=Ascaris suum TaxID=6253 RepID=F1KZY7_ASCSU